jgi:hypothetical protein
MRPDLSLQYLSSPTFVLVARTPVTSRTPEVTSTPDQWPTILTDGTHSAASPRSRAESSRVSDLVWYVGDDLILLYPQVLRRLGDAF